jgi:predicted DCC family thiol-disulfide oxidoreductase YuxK
MPSLKAFFTNMSLPMPFHKRIYLVFRNNLIKIRKRQDCCGHQGEPGCCD